MSTCVNAAAYGSPLSSKVAHFNAVANKHTQSQAINPFSNDNKVGGLAKPQFSKEEYGRPVRGSLSEARGFKANMQVCKEMLELCEIIDKHGEPLFSPEEKANDPRIVISFGELFSMYTVISNKLVGILLRARKYNLLDFEGECLFQRRDDHVPVILLKPIEKIREILRGKVEPEEKLSEEEKSSEEESPDEKSTEEELPEEKVSEKESPEEESPEEKVSKEESPEKKLSEEESPEEKVSEKESPEEKLSEEETAEEKVSEKESPEEKLSEEGSPEEKVSKEESPEEKVSNEESPEEKVNKEESPEEKVSKEESPEKKLNEESLEEKPHSDENN